MIPAQLLTHRRFFSGFPNGPFDSLFTIIRFVFLSLLSPYYRRFFFTSRFGRGVRVLSPGLLLNPVRNLARFFLFDRAETDVPFFPLRPFAPSC